MRYKILLTLRNEEKLSDRQVDTIVDCLKRELTADERVRTSHVVWEGVVC